ncbi:MAG: carboxypeptidase regulatory-like domain-containing protein, partial [Acidimicrobiales bacterium]
SSPGFEAVLIEVLVQPNRLTPFPNLTLRALANLTVQVRDGGSCDPFSGECDLLGGAAVTLDSDDDDATVAVVDGEANVGELHPLAYAVVLTDASGAPIGGATVTLEPGGGAFGPTDTDGRVLVSPSARADFTANITGTTAAASLQIDQTANTADTVAGEAEFALVALEYTVDVEKDGYSGVAPQTVVLDPADSVTLEFILDRLNSISGSITDQDGDDLDGVTVTIVDENGADVPGADVAVTGASYTITDVPAGMFAVTGSKAGYESHAVAVEFAELNDGEQIVVLELRQLVDLTVHAQDIAQTPVGGATVTLGLPRVSGTTNPEGVATLPSELREGPYAFGSDVVNTAVVLNPGAVQGTTGPDGAVVLQVPGRGRYTLTIVGSGAGHVVTADAQFEPAETDAATGDASFPDLAPAAYNLSVTHVDFAPYSQLVGVHVDLTHDVTLQRLNAITGTITALATGEGIEGVTVTALRAGDPPVTATTLTGGTYQIDHLQTGLYTISVTAVPDGYALSSVAPPSRDVSFTTFDTVSPGNDFTVQRLNAITGRVTDVASGVGLAGVTVSAQLGADPPVTDATNRNGNYRIPNLGVGTYTVTITVVPTDYDIDSATPKSRDVVFTQFDTVDTANRFTLAKLPGRMAGTVTGADGDGLPGVGVTAESLYGESLATTTAGDGSWSLGELDPTVWNLTYSTGGYSPLTMTGPPVSGGETGTADVALAAKGNAVSGTAAGRNANDAAARPLDGVTVTLLDAAGAVVGQQTVGAEGYSFRHLDDGSYTLVFERDGYEPQRPPVELSRRQRAVVDSVLVAANGSLTVSVQAGDGAPVAGAVVRLSSPTQIPGGRGAETGPDGLATFDALPPSSDYAVAVDGRTAGFARAGAGPIAVAPGQRDARAEVTLPAPGSVSGVVSTVADARQPAVPTDGVEIALYAAGADLPVGSTFSGATGRPGEYRFDGLDASLTYRLVFSFDSHEAVERAGVVVTERGTATVDATLRRL